MLVWTRITHSGDSHGYMLNIEIGASGCRLPNSQHLSRLPLGKGCPERQEMYQADGCTV
jgi:hypothetical protein